ncbi:class I adenylate-forming enzyme family protein [Saccharomonospora sp. NPDC046836]|uniref:class I adenylate-forming enzyme family protein n=1 Tax=Saccharomonospora sp. NPDC046836 TaxID=3156921 RepID=UPI0033C9271C
MTASRASPQNKSTTLAELLPRSAAHYPDHVALAFPDEAISYAELLERSMIVARGLVSKGVRPGDNVGLLAPNSPEFAEGFFGAALIGAVLVPLNVRYRAAELSYIIEHAQLTAVLTTDRVAARTDFCKTLAEAVPGLDSADAGECLNLPSAPHLRSVAMLQGAGGPGCLGAAEFRQSASTVDISAVARMRSGVTPSDPALILYTSGTTARPKGCVITQESIVRASMQRTAEAVPFPEPRAGRALWHPLPFFHIAAMQAFVYCIGAGVTLLTDVYLDADRAVDHIKKWRATSLWPGFIAAMRSLMDSSAFDPEELRSISSIVTGGPSKDLRRIQEMLPWATIVNGSGMSEMAGFYCLSHVDDTLEERATSVGKLLSGFEARLLDPVTGAVVADGELGELLLRGYSMMSHYYRDPERTAETIDAGGWLRTGDLFRRLASGHMIFEGRLKDMLKVGGENVPAVEVESFLCGHPHIRDAAIVGIPDPRLDEVPVAFVEQEPGAELSEHDVIAFCRSRIASFKVPRAVYFMAAVDWPRSATKLDKRALRTMALDHLKPTAE